ncbi:PAS domain-containing sensor histidine kinase [Leptospira sp. 2 VSF19]|uniref:histidine kinase n=1 Tax=Leptospira soteropolitanensis TaxID=2950025 RepID=A0AAW5VJQ9_9LEPT|nr:PAS domain-containing sensor histidine kinase [Leptospira soteropolitanensis]MCW7492589.1 PAS domain-containing sensor histidine kinase [Leptospira soteropolitanensis]MCW7500272.1 PAS domain-containing sensor histidine kinase [Leptospira soteropolitanensis]MCW7522693.1 PAS domain-containing sensor histidine kinase [Leptospira soteropolitanensis]MCW7526549.1 PAS domain-containing sensor histidine kinase [Leptospira soteropolitanensis]MCW7530242.1 PAS domain-containing sensor histidine kinase
MIDELLAILIASGLLFAAYYYHNAYRREKKLRLILFRKNLNNSEEIERTIREKEKQYQDIYDTANSIIIRWSPDFKIHSINPYAEEFFQLSKEEAEGKDVVLDLFHIPLEKSNEVKSKLWNIFHRPEQNIRQEYDVFIGENDKRTVTWSNRILKNEFGYPYEVLSIGNDITNRKIAEENLMKSYERILDLYNNAPCGYHSLDKDDTIVSINDTELDWLGYTREDIVGNFKFCDLLTESSRDKYKLITDSFPNENLTGVELEFVRKDKTTFFVSLNSTATYDKAGNFIISKSTVFDITDRKLAEDKLNDYSQKIQLQNKRLQKAVEAAIKANRSKSVFFSKITHELRTPLHAVIGFSQILEKDPNLPNHLKGYVDSLYENGVHLLGMINDILDLSKIEAGKMTETREPFSLVQLWDTLFSMFSYRFSEKSISFELLNAASIESSYYVADLQKIRQILVNLLGNALKFTTQGSVSLEIKIESSLEHNFDMVKFIVRDTGIGIPNDQLHSIFEAFQQTEQGSSYKEGTGLGLSICHQLVEFLGGTISVNSNLGEGSEFWFEIPLTKLEVIPEPLIQKSKIGPTHTNQLEQTQKLDEPEVEFVQTFLNTSAPELKKEILQLIRIQNFGQLIGLLDKIQTEDKGKNILEQKVKNKKYKFLIDLVQSSNPSE